MDQYIERRNIPADIAQLRVERRADSGPAKIVGYGGVFHRPGEPGTEFRLFPDIIERIMPSAFDEAVREDDVRSFYNHEASQMLGRRNVADSAPTLELSVDRIGLAYAATPPSTIVPANLLELIDRRDVNGSSMQFLAFPEIAKRGRVVWVEEVVDGMAVSIREIHNLQLIEVGPVVMPTYEATSAEHRARQERDDRQRLEAERTEARSGHPPGIPELELRQRQIEVGRFLRSC